ncbi:hypothetical protein UlMin_011717 [Ulmus minor]
MTSYLPSEIDSYATDSVASSPRSELSSEAHTRVRFMCSYGGKIVPRPNDNQLRYVGGDTRIVAVHRTTNFSGLVANLSKLSGTSNLIVKYQLPNEDLDALISVTTDEDVENMMDEYDRLAQIQNPKSYRLRLFLFPKEEESTTNSISSSISSILHGSTNRDNWFIDALNNGGAPSVLERGRSEASSIVSEVPDYLFGLENSEEFQNRGDPKLIKGRPYLQEYVSVSDPGSPAPVVSSSFCSTSSVQSIPNLPPVKTKPDYPTPVPESKENQIESFGETGETPVSQPAGYPGNPMLQYVSDPRYSGQPVHQVPVYYVQGPASIPPPGNAPVQSYPIQASYVQQYAAVSGQIPMGYHNPVPGMGQAYGGGWRPVTNMDPHDGSGRIVSDGGNQQIFYGVRNGAMVSPYPGMAMPAGEEMRGAGSDVNAGRVNYLS